MTRPSWDEYFIKMANLTSERSTCIRKKVGAVMVRGKRVIATGYNGICITGATHCIDTGQCYRDKLNIESGTRYEAGACTHGEASAILQCARFGISTEGCTIYINGLVCILCAKMIVSAGITRVVCLDEDRPADGVEFLSCAGVEVTKISEK